MDEKGVVDVEDMALGLIKFENGATVFLETSWAAHTGGGGTSEFRVLGTKAGATLSPLTIYTVQNEQLLDTTPVLRGKQDHYVEEIRNFLDCIKEDKDCVPSAEEGLFVTQIIDALYESAEKGEAVQVAT
jgi:predicted dehydrogenase